MSYVPRYRRGHGFQFVPPVTAIHLAALTPSDHEIEVVHEQVRRAPVDDWPDLVCLSFFSGFAGRAYEVADQYRARGIRVVAGGPHVSYWIEEALAHVDSVVIGEAESVWNEMLADAERGIPKKVYRGEARELANLPTPRYDLLEKSFVVPRVVQATRGCPFTCSFCSVPDLNPGFRVRPVDDVVRDIAATHFPRYWQEKVAWFWDDNLLAKRAWSKDLLRAMTGLDRWWLTQASIDIVKDKELLDLMERSGCIGIFLGIESLDQADLASVRKKQNKTNEYRDAIERLHDRGICVMAGFISGFDDQTPDVIHRTADRLNEIGVDVPFLSILTPFRGTPLYDEHLRAGRILRDRDWSHYSGYGVAFRPAKMTPDELLGAHRTMWNRAFCPQSVLHRLSRGAGYLRPGAMMLSSAMNGFYGLKQVTGNEPAISTTVAKHPIHHPDPQEAPARLTQLRRPKPYS
ncbi:MAG: B12-binding domain-containing radical SAM protein, partial [Polyangiaceae bacterium]